jgi:hypothetical protein
MSFKLSSVAVKADTTYDLQLVDPVTGDLLWADGDVKSKPVAIQIYGKNSKAYRNATEAIQARRFDNVKKKYTPAQMQADATEILVACSIKTINLEYDGEEELNTAAQFRKLYNDNDLDFVRKAVDGGIEEVANFLK